MPSIVIFVSPASIDANRTKGQHLPVFTIKDGPTTSRTMGVEILGPSRLMYSREKQPHGVSAWLETEGEVRYLPELAAATNT